MASQRNMGLLLAATGGALPDFTWLYFALAQFPVYLSAPLHAAGTAAEVGRQTMAAAAKLGRVLINPALARLSECPASLRKRLNCWLPRTDAMGPGADSCSAAICGSKTILVKWPWSASHHIPRPCYLAESISADRKH
jgi:hypothetical protein